MQDRGKQVTNDDDDSLLSLSLFTLLASVNLIDKRMVSTDHESSSSTLRSRTNVASSINTPTTSLASTSSISSIDDETHELEFGGAPGTLAMMVGFPILFYYLYVCIFFNHGKSLSPFSLFTKCVLIPECVLI